MSDINMTNRQCCDLDIRDYATKAPWMFADFCNTTTMGFSSDAVYAMKKGGKCIKFDNPLEGTIAMTFQVHPFRVYSMLSDGEIENEGVIAEKKIVKCETAGTLTLPEGVVAENIVDGTLFVYAEDDFGGTAIKGTVSESTFSAPEGSANAITVGSSYVVAYLLKKEKGIQKISFNNKKLPRFFYIQMSTLDKNENGELVPVRITAYKASPQRNLELSFSSSRDTAEITITCDCLTDENDDMLDMIEITE